MSSSETPFITPTLAEIFIRQGHLSQGLAIYRKLLRAAPMNPQLQTRVAELSEELRRMENLSPNSSLGPNLSAGNIAVQAEPMGEEKSSQDETLAELHRWLMAIRKRKGHV
ncbi:MAG: hypothetical protein GX751_05005 [Desulfuromonadaceae bacterium]|nr:hypothetical protein [Desulfuromonadaceae bacterium]